ncbi:hypothetical protein [Streptomyces sp. NBC_01235]|uniref:hypothetical protein n=1 Tax=Streptomyces sp. NBC_01235 TaxID=2903788 RepID=UPI002E162843|nr:hypothetical protein OG289_05265 [Streptomyces sp. NBC_01235]
MRIRYAAVTCASAAALLSLTGCTAPGAGITGITVTATGRPVGVLMICHKHIDGATLYADDDPNGPEVGDWRRTRPATGLVTWPLATGGPGWTVDKPMPTALDRGRTYILYGWTDDDSWSAADVSFTLTDLAALQPGQVRYFAGDVKGADDDGYRTGSLAEFRAAACDDTDT